MYLYWDEDNSPNSFNDVTVETFSGVSAGTRQIKGQKLQKRRKRKSGTTKREKREPVKVSLDL